MTLRPLPLITRRPGDLPDLARPDLRLGPDPAPPLPTLVEPPPLAVGSPSEEPLVDVAHPRVLRLSSYWHAGWTRATPRTLLREGAAAALVSAAESLPEDWGLVVFDAWRPLDMQIELYEAAYSDPSLPPGFVAPPSTDPALPPPHLTGGTVDVSLTWRGIPLELGTPFDHFGPEARADALENEPGPSRELRRVLYRTMRGAGFVVLDCEWWHYELGTGRWAAITGGEPRYGAAGITTQGPVRT